MFTILWLLLIFMGGLVVLYFGAEATLHGAVSIATRMGVSQLVIGLTLVAFGTSCPELSLDISAAIQGKSELAFGDLVGSNIANIGLIMGIGAIVCPLRVHMRLLAPKCLAARRNEADIVVGNVIGSNISNMLLVLAVVAIICPVNVKWISDSKSRH